MRNSADSVFYEKRKRIVDFGSIAVAIASLFDYGGGFRAKSLSGESGTDG